MQEIGGCVTQTAVSKDIIIEQIKFNRDNHKYGNVTDTNWWRDGKRIALIAGGPSLRGQLDRLPKYQVTMACGGIHDYLIENGIIPTFCAVVDPDPLINNYMSLANPSHGIHYLVSSQCSPKVFEFLACRGCKISMWHADGADLNRPDVFGEGSALVGGGCTIGTRAIVMAIGMGFFRQDLYGFDTCLTDDYKHHAYEFHDPKVETVGNIVEIQLGGPDSPTFKVAEYMLAQIFDFKSILKAFANCLDIKVYGGGALAYLMELGKPKEDI